MKDGKKKRKRDQHFRRFAPNAAMMTWRHPHEKPSTVDADSAIGLYARNTNGAWEFEYRSISFDDGQWWHDADFDELVDELEGEAPYGLIAWMPLPAPPTTERGYFDAN